ncbi:MAG: hypothetical protein K8R69_03945, partial [Deltaproteobacteria bacterium]|nr:hypothetical protein [Deltaproteobacteria bacterium]
MISGNESPAWLRRLSVADRAEYASFSAESDAVLRGEALLNFAQRQEVAGSLEAAADIYASIRETCPDTVLQGRARQSLDAILGRGSGGPRAEFLLRRLTQEAAEPSSLLAMGLAGAAFRMTRLAVLSRLSASPTAHFLSRGFGARALSGLAGFAVEAPTFTLTGR